MTEHTAALLTVAEPASCRTWVAALHLTKSDHLIPDSALSAFIHLTVTSFSDLLRLAAWVPPLLDRLSENVDSSCVLSLMLCTIASQAPIPACAVEHLWITYLFCVSCSSALGQSASNIQPVYARLLSSLNSCISS